MAVDVLRIIHGTDLPLVAEVMVVVIAAAAVVVREVTDVVVVEEAAKLLKGSYRTISITFFFF